MKAHGGHMERVKWALWLFLFTLFLSLCPACHERGRPDQQRQAIDGELCVKARSRQKGASVWAVDLVRNGVTRLKVCVKGETKMLGQETQHKVKRGVGTFKMGLGLVDRSLKKNTS